MNSIDNIIQFTYGIENNGPFFNKIVSCPDEGFLTSVYRKNFAVSLPTHVHSCHLPNQKMAAFYTFVNHALNVCLDTILFNNEIQYLKTITLDKGCNSSIVDKALL